jgi:acyl dehydratase
MSEVKSPETGVETSKRLVVGYSFESAGRTITETDIVNFACLSGDFNRLHVDHEYASKTRFGQRIAHGLLVLSVLSGLTTQTLEYRQIEPIVLALIDLTCKFPKPTFIGDTIFVRVTVAERVSNVKPGRDEITFCREAVNQRGEVVVKANFIMQIQNAEIV